MGTRIAAIGDIHACFLEFKELYEKLEWLSLDEIWSLGDFLERAPYNAETIGFIREKGIKSVIGNHEDSLLKHYDRVSNGGDQPFNPEKRRALSELSKEDFEFIRSLPDIHIIDDLGLFLVHGGMWPLSSFEKPNFAIYNQPHSVCRAQMINPQKMGESRWWGVDAVLHRSKKTEEQNIADGFERWYKLYDFDYDCVFGHSVFNQPFVFQGKGKGRCIGIDNGICFDGMLTAAVFGIGDVFFVSIKAKKLWSEISRRLIKEE